MSITLKLKTQGFSCSKNIKNEMLDKENKVEYNEPQDKYLREEYKDLSDKIYNICYEFINMNDFFNYDSYDNEYDFIN